MLGALRVFLFQGFKFLMCKIWTRISVKYVNVFQIVLSITASNNIELAPDQRHRVPCPCLWRRVHLRLLEVVTVLPR